MEIKIERKLRCVDIVRASTKNGRIRRIPIRRRHAWRSLQATSADPGEGSNIPGVESGLCFPSDTGGYGLQKAVGDDQAFKLGSVKEAGNSHTDYSARRSFRRTYNDLCRRAGVDNLGTAIGGRAFATESE